MTDNQTTTASAPQGAFLTWLKEWQAKHPLSASTIQEIELNVWFARKSEGRRV